MTIQSTNATLTSAATEDWAARIRSDDPRFKDLVPAYDGTLKELFEVAANDPDLSIAEEVVKALPEIRRVVSNIGSDSLDVALAELLRTSGNTERATAITAARLGWHAGGPRTLQSVGNEFSVTRERVRQVADRSLGSIRSKYLPQLEAAIRLISEECPIPASDAAVLLVERGISKVPIHPKAIAAAGSALDYEVTFTIDDSIGTRYVLARDSGDLKPVLWAARRRSGRVGLASVTDVKADLGAAGQRYEEEELTQILTSSKAVDFLDDGWFWMPSIPASKNRLRNVTRHILAVAPRAHIKDLYDGLRRRFLFLGIKEMPPLTAVRQVYARHPEFVLHDDDFVESVEPLDYRVVLSRSEQVLVDVLRTSPGGVMERNDFEEAVAARGVSRGTFNAYTSYSPILDHPGRSMWCLRGNVASIGKDSGVSPQAGEPSELPGQQAGGARRRVSV
ncbi:MAG: hypothetical protein M0008_10120 [Actinomycetota bacterium]|nr:hypothetical protein [Actinomycetota bacterium]